MTLARTSRAEISRPWSREGSLGLVEDASTSKITSPAPRSLSAKDREPVPVERVAAHVPVEAECALHAAILIKAPLADGDAARVAEV